MIILLSFNLFNLSCQKLPEQKPGKLKVEKMAILPVITGRELEVVLVAPNGAVEGKRETDTVIVTFNQPMVPLAEVPPEETQGPLVLEPEVSGKYRWMGTSTLTFTPAQKFPLSTSFIAKVPAGTKSLLGNPFKKKLICEIFPK